MTYTNYNGVEVTEEFFFNLTKAEVAEMELSVEGGLTEQLQKIVNAVKGKEIIETFKWFILKAYGEKSADGRRFIKNDEVREGFSQTEAFSDLFIELATNAESAAAFINGVIPDTPILPKE